MLVVTRRSNEKIVFPTLGITVHVLGVADRRARVGIEAPPEVKVLRDEICPASARLSDPSPGGKAHHAMANALSKATLAIHLARKQCEAGRAADADAVLDTALRALEGLEQPRQPVTPGRRYRLLIVEDDANERELLAGLMGMNGCECATAADGVAALEYLEAGGSPDVVLLDMAMPRLSGPETLRRIRADGRFGGLRVFSVSSTPPSELNVPEGPGGFDGWFPKPLNPRRLWDAIQTALRSPATAN
jgi:carbon storage regulator CsrA